MFFTCLYFYLRGIIISMKSHSFRIAFIFLILVGVLNFIAITLHLYWTLHYFDSLVHFTAGVSVGFASLWFVSLFFVKNNAPLNRNYILTVAFVGALIVGIVWEVFELVFGVTTLADGIHYITDTSSDLLMDVLGGLVAAFYTRKKIFKTQ